jgi:hypothetical protein
MIAQWARENGVKGFDHLDPVNREKQRRWNTKKANEKTREAQYESKKH